MDIHSYEHSYVFLNQISPGIKSVAQVFIFFFLGEKKKTEMIEEMTVTVFLNAALQTQTSSEEEMKKRRRLWKIYVCGSKHLKCKWSKKTCLSPMMGHLAHMRAHVLSGDKDGQSHSWSRLERFRHQVHFTSFPMENFKHTKLTGGPNKPSWTQWLPPS